MKLPKILNQKYKGIPILLWILLFLAIYPIISLFFLKDIYNPIEFNFALFMTTLMFLLIISAIVSYISNNPDKFGYLILSPITAGAVGAFVFYLLTETKEKVHPTVYIAVSILFIFHIMSIYYLMKSEK